MTPPTPSPLAPVEARRFAVVYTLGWASYGVAYGLAVTTEARTMTLAVARWSSHVLLGALLGGGLFVLLSRTRTSWGWWRHGAAAVALSVSWALSAAALLDVLTGSEALQSLLAHPGRLRWQLLAGGMMYALTAAVVHWRRATVQWARAHTAAEQQSRLRAEAELRALRSRLDPHFLFNTLHSLGAVARQAPERVEAGLAQLASLLRYTLRTQAAAVDRVMFSSEWAFVRDYLELERHRLGERLLLVARVSDEAHSAELPPFTLQPLVENAIKHAVAVREQPTRVWVEADVCDEVLVLSVRDDGPGTAQDPLAPRPSGVHTGVGLTVIRDRLALAYDGRATLVVTSQPGEGFRVQVSLPLEDA